MILRIEALHVIETKNSKKSKFQNFFSIYIQRKVGNKDTIAKNNIVVKDST